ncbi:MAG: hypothetical protein MUP17_11685 [candidate division Zixibacteria bacterium]|nr:hypothetical protein [candidate division Zixibacteria bacterium]
MYRKLLLQVLIILFCMAYHGLITEAGVFRPKPSSIVLADSIIAAIDRGDSIIIRDCKILGPLIKTGTEERADTITSYIDIRHSIFSDTIDFQYCYFIEKMNFFDDSLNRAVSFYYVTFGKDATFSGTVFEIASFSGCTFGQAALFEKARFSRWANFSWTIFNEEVNFSLVNFPTDYQQTIRFRQLEFLGRLGPEHWRGIPITAWGAWFIRTHFKGDVYFDNTNFGGYADFRWATFSRVVLLIPQELKKILISWKQLEGHLVYERSANYGLMKLFEEQRMLDDADGVYLFLKDQERMEKPKLLRYLEYWLFKMPFGYGVKPLNTLYLSIIIVIIFALFYSKPYAIKEIERQFWYQRMRRLSQDVPNSFWKRFYNALYFSVHTFIIGVVSNWNPTDKYLINTRRIKLFKFRTLSMIEGVLGWVLLAVFIVILTRKFIR